MWLFAVLCGAVAVRGWVVPGGLKGRGALAFI
jgi:hypothetical protein